MTEETETSATVFEEAVNASTISDILKILPTKKARRTLVREVASANPEALKLFPKSIIEEVVSKENHNSVQILKAMGDHRGAYEIEKKNGNISTAILTGYGLITPEELEDMIEQFSKKYDGDTKACTRNLLDDLTEKALEKGDTENAEKFMMRELELTIIDAEKTQEPYAYLRAGRLSEKIPSQKEKAQSYYDKAYEIAEKNPDRQQFAKIAIAVGRTEEAEKAYTALLEQLIEQIKGLDGRDWQKRNDIEERIKGVLKDIKKRLDNNTNMYELRITANELIKNWDDAAEILAKQGLPEKGARLLQQKTGMWDASYFAMQNHLPVLAIAILEEGKDYERALDMDKRHRILSPIQRRRIAEKWWEEKIENGSYTQALEIAKTCHLKNQRRITEQVLKVIPQAVEEEETEEEEVDEE